LTETIRPGVSVAICTFDGMDHLEPLLDSLLAQTEAPEELVVGDDGSSDETPLILDRFRRRAPFPVRITRNPKRLGITCNFAATLARCREEISVLADQDDLFYPQKLAQIRNAFVGNPACTVAFSDADLIDEHGTALGMTLWQRIGFNQSHRRAFRRDALSTLLRRNPGYGMTMAVRTEAAHDVLPVSPCWTHDSWLALALATVGEATLIEETLCGYRQHAGQAVPFRLIPDRRPWLSRIHAPEYHRFEYMIGCYRSALSRFRKLGIGSEEQHQALESLIRHYRVRGRLPLHKPARLIPLLSELFARRYHRFSNGFAGFAKDLVSR